MKKILAFIFLLMILISFGCAKKEILKTQSNEQKYSEKVFTHPEKLYSIKYPENLKIENSGNFKQVVLLRDNKEEQNEKIIFEIIDESYISQDEKEANEIDYISRIKTEYNGKNAFKIIEATNNMAIYIIELKPEKTLKITGIGSDFMDIVENILKQISF